MAAKYGPHLERLAAVAGSLSGRLVAISGEREAGPDAPSSVHVLEVAKLKPVLSGVADAAVRSLCFLADDLLVGGTARGALCGWDGTSDSTKPVLGVEAGVELCALASDASGKLLAAGGVDGTLRLYELEVKGGKPSLRAGATRALSGRAIRAVGIDPKGTVVAAAGDDGIIRTLSLESLGARAGLGGEANEPPRAAQPVAAGAGFEMREMPCGEGGIFALAFSGDGRIVAGCGDGSIRVCFLEGAADEEDRSRDAAHAAPVRGLVFGPQLYDEADRELPRRVFSAGEDGVLKAWLLDSRRKPRTLELSGAPLYGLAWLPASPRVKADKRGGTLAVINKNRQLLTTTVNDRSEPSEQLERVSSELERLREDLGAKSQQVREAAVTALSEIPEDDARKLLDRALAGDKQADVRRHAADMMGLGGRRRSRPALRQALHDNDKKVRAAALEALQLIEKDAPLSPLRAALGSKHADIRKRAVAKLPALRSVSPLVPSLCAGALRDAAPEVRVQALDALYELSGAGSLEPVRVAQERGPADMRQQALIRMGRAKMARGAEGAELLDRALDDPDGAVRGTAFLIAVACRGRLAARVAEADAHTQKALADLTKEGSLADGPAEGELAGEDLEPLFAAIACRHADSALRGARCLALLGDSRATGALLQLSREGDVEIRRHTVEALAVAAAAMPGDDRLVARLQWLLDDEDATVRTWSFDALKKLCQPDGAAGELELAALTMRCAHEDVRVRALQSLVQFGPEGDHAQLSERADTILGHALDDEADKVRAEAFRTLWAWHSKTPKVVLERGVASRHADIRNKVVAELERQEDGWAGDLLLKLISDSSAQVGIAAHKALTEGTDRSKKRAESFRSREEVHLAALGSPRPKVRVAGCKAAARWAKADDVRLKLRELIKDEQPEVHIAAIEAVDKLMPDDQEAFALAFGSIFYVLRVRAGELCGKRRDKRAVEPMKDLLTIPKTHINRPSDEIRGRAARALADVGDPDTIPFYVSMLDDEDGNVREMGGRGLATACRPGEEKPLLDALAHADLAVRSWAAEGLARLGDDRGVPVLAGTLKHEHRPIRVGSILSFVALGPDGVRGILQGLEDSDRTVQDLVFAIIVARDVALCRAGLPPDLLLSALSSVHPEIRFAAARVLEARSEIGRSAPAREGANDLLAVATELVGPRKPEKAGDMKDWPAESDRQALLNVLINALASDHPALRYASAQVLALQPQPLGFWREAKQLAGPTASGKPKIPHTNWEDEERKPRKKGWVRRLFGRGPSTAAEAGVSATERLLTVIKFAGGPDPRPVPPVGGGLDDDEIRRLVFGTYAGLVRQAPPSGEADETHRVRRDSIERLAELARSETVGRDAVLPVLRRAISDPHHLVRKAAVAALGTLYPEGAKEPLGLALRSSAADVGRAAVQELVAAASTDEEAAALAREAINAPNPEVRAFALAQLPKLYEEGSIEPFLVALSGQYPDVRLSVVDRLIEMRATRDPRVDEALGRAMESDHEDLRLKAAVALARRGDRRTVDVLAALLRSEEGRVVSTAREALVALANANPEAAPAAAEAVARRLEDDPDKTAPRSALVDTLAVIGSTAADGLLLSMLAPEKDTSLAAGRSFADEDTGMRGRALTALVAIARDRSAGARIYPDGTRREPYDEPLLLRYLGEAAASQDRELRLQAVESLRAVDDNGAEELLARLVADRDEGVRVAACEAQAFRAKYVETATLNPLTEALRSGRRELVLPAAAGMAVRRRPEAFQALMLVFKAGEGPERERATLALGMLGDRRALEELEPLVDPRSEIPDEDRALAPNAAMALGCMLPHLEDEEERKRVRETVERLVREGSSAIRIKALSGLRLAGDDRSRSVLEGVTGDRYDESSVRRHAVNELGLLASQASEPVLAEVLDDRDRGVRRAALEALRRIFPGERTRVSLLALRSSHYDISGPAAGFLARRGDAETLVSRLAEVKEGEVRRRLRRGLVRRGACPVPALTQLLVGEHAAARAEAAWIAGAAGDAGRELCDAVTQAVQLSRSGWSDTRKQAGGRPDAVTRDRIQAHEEAWRAGLWAATRLGAAAGDEVRGVVGDGDVPTGVRREALRFLAAHGGADDLSAIQPCLSDPDAGIRTAAAAAVATLAPEQTSGVISDLTVADGAALRPIVMAAIPVAGRQLLESDVGRRVTLPVVLGSRRVEELVAIATAGGKDPARLAAIASLGRIGGEEAEAALKQVLEQEKKEDTIRAAAFRALRRLQRAATAATRYEEGQDKEKGGWGGGGGGYDDDEDYDDEDYDDDDDNDWSDVLDDDDDDDDDDGGDDGEDDEDWEDEY
jgi:ParB family chromosome partitioning protein